MSAPELPAVFGNYVLGDTFHEVVSPPDISWLPQTVGWAWLGAALAVLLLYRAWRWWRHWYANRYRREAIARVRALQAAHDTGNWLGELNRLLKLSALAGYPRREVAALTGDRWVRFLNAQCPEPAFTGRHAQLLARGPYRPQAPAEADREGLLRASLHWLETHRGPADA